MSHSEGTLMRGPPKRWIATADAGLACTEQPRTESGSARPHNIELDIDGTSVWIWRGAETRDGDGDHRRAEGPEVIGPMSAVRVMAATKRVDFRRGLEGLAALVREVMQTERSAARFTSSARSARSE
jgi:hypothetical protein